MTRFNANAFASMIKSRRGNMSLRDVAEITGISASTLSRIENGKIPDMEEYLKLCDWFLMKPFNETHLITDNMAIDRELETVEKIEALLLADGHIHENITNAIMILVRHAYNENRK